MHAVIRSYSGQGASELFDLIEQRSDEVSALLKGVTGFVSYTGLRTADGGVTLTVCQDKAGTDESSSIAAGWVKENFTGSVNPPAISEGDTILHLGM
jgi:hypothetical protein